jgi:hypothetical protein
LDLYFNSDKHKHFKRLFIPIYFKNSPDFGLNFLFD